MKHRKTPEIIWIVVLVESGVPILVEAYRYEKVARRREHLLRAKMRENYDEAGIFEVKVGQKDPLG
ncbi:MAG: hypothetical protein HYZ49_06960 [Chloroflexi bacterium]|nr:hypothetical protein [Chloroflexota bacterium]